MNLRAATLARSRHVVGGAVLCALLAGPIGSAHAAPLPPGPTTTVAAPSPVDPYSSYVGQSTCDPTTKPGTLAVLRLAMDYYRIGRSMAINRECSKGGQSEHKEGRAFDWGLNVANPAEKAAGDQFTEWLIAVGPDEKPGYIARRLGVMYIIWNTQIWSASNASRGWQAYTGSSPHTDHVHVSLSWNGAYQRTSWWTGSLVAQTPFGNVDAITTSDRDLTVQGWALDPDASSPIDAHVYVDGVGVSTSANLPRPDIAAAFGNGERHGFTVTVPQGLGPHTVCTYAIDSDPIGHTALECRTVVVRDSAPTGVVDSVTATSTSITVSGWTLDPDTSSSNEAHVYLDGVGVALLANQARPDIGRIFGRGSQHGFAYTAQVQPGRHDLCVFGINTSGGANTLLLCKSVVAEDTPTAPPYGVIDSIIPSATGVTVSGWTVDPDTTASTDIHVYIDGVGVAARADQVRPDVAAAFGMGDRHGYAYAKPLSAGAHSLCAYAINTGPGSHTLLGCRDFSIP